MQKRVEYEKNGTLLCIKYSFFFYIFIYFIHFFFSISPIRIWFNPDLKTIGPFKYHRTHNGNSKMFGRLASLIGRYPTANRTRSKNRILSTPLTYLKIKYPCPCAILNVLDPASTFSEHRSLSIPFLNGFLNVSDLLEFTSKPLARPRELLPFFFTLPPHTLVSGKSFTNSDYNNTLNFREYVRTIFKSKPYSTLEDGYVCRYQYTPGISLEISIIRYYRFCR